MKHYCEICEKEVESLYDEVIKSLEYCKGTCGHISLVQPESEADAEEATEGILL
jgi:hypothetical protein